MDEELKKAVGLNDQQYINQFPFEACLVMKHHLAETVQKVAKLANFVCYVVIKVPNANTYYLSYFMQHAAMFIPFCYRPMVLLNGSSQHIILKHSLVNS